MRNPTRWAALAVVAAVMTCIAGRGSLHEALAADPPASTKKIEAETDLIQLLDEAVLAADRAGVLGSVAFREGDAVHEGDIVATIRDEVARAALAVAAKEAESDVDIRYAIIAGAVSRAEHEKALAANRQYPKTVPDVEVRRLELAAEKSVLEKESAELRHAVNLLKRDQAQAELDTYRITAPFDGIVTRVDRLKGEAVRQGDPVLKIVNPSRVRVDGKVHLRDIADVKPGTDVSVRLDLADVAPELSRLSFKGKIVFVDVKAEPTSQMVRVRAEVANPDNILRAGLKARMTIDTGKPATASTGRAP